MTVFKKDGTLTVNAKGHIYRIHQEATGKKAVRIHPKWWTGSSRSRLQLAGESAYYAIIEICQTFRLPYSTGNDAPRGGVTGDFIEIKVDRRQKFWSLAI